MGLNARHATLLEARGLDIELLESLGVSSEGAKLGPDTIRIPYYRDELEVGTKYRTIAGEKRFLQERGSAQILYHRDCLADETLAQMPIIVTEGEVDCWAALQAGFPRSVSVPGGAPSVAVGDRAAAKYTFIEDMPESTKGATIILAVDSDDPGSALRADLALRFGAQRCKWVKYPQGCKDLADALAKYGVKGVVESITRAQWMVGNVYRMMDIPPVPPALPHVSGFPGLEDHYKLRLGDFCVITGVPGSGKTAFVNDLVCRMVSKHRWPACFASFEQHPTIDHHRALRSWYGGGLVKDLSDDTLVRADRWIDENFSFVVPDDESYPTVPWLLDRFEASALRYGTRLFVLDPWNELEHDRANGVTMTEHVGIAIRDFKAFARKYEAHLIIVAHPVKLRRDKDGQYPIPTLYDISDSAHWSNKADIGIVIHRESEEETIIKVSKSRYHDQIGRPGEASVRYVWERATYEPFNNPNYAERL